MNKTYTKRQAIHKLRMLQRRHDQWNRKSNAFISSKTYTDYHKKQRMDLAREIDYMIHMQKGATND